MKSGPPEPPSAPGQDARTPAGFRAGVIAGIVAAMVLAALVGAIVVLFPLTGANGEAAAPRLASLQDQAAQDQAQVHALRGQLAASDADLAVERAARRALEENLAAMQTQAGQLRDRVAFYDQLFPAGPAGTVSIRAVDIARAPAGLRYRVLLMRSARPGQAPFVGNLRFVARGTTDPASPAPPVLVPLEMDQYRSSEGVLTLPPGFTPTEVTVEVVQDGAVLASQQAAVAF